VIDFRLKWISIMARPLSASESRKFSSQGFIELNEEAKARYASPLRFTPGVASIVILIGLVLQSPILLGSMALVALSGALLPNGMLIDLVYNLGVRHVFHAPPLPSTPKPRQFSYLLSTVFLASSAVSFHYGLWVFGLIFGGLVIVAGTILTTTLWCLGSWYYRIIFRRAWVTQCDARRNLSHSTAGS